MHRMINIPTIALLLGSLCYEPLEGCTGLKILTSAGEEIHGRTAEFGTDLDLSLLFIPKGTQFQAAVPVGKGLSYRSKYASVGCRAFEENHLLDGINEAGLAVGSFYFPHYAEYADREEGAVIGPTEFGHWLLTQFATVEEVQGALQGITIAPAVVKGWGDSPPPFHWVVYDRDGACLVIEPRAGKLRCHENPLGAFTNSPTFDWHLTNLTNYVNLSPKDVPPKFLGTLKLTPSSNGSGLHGLPGDFTSPSRFLRAALFSATSVIPSSLDEGVRTAYHLLNQFDIPRGAVRLKSELSEVIEWTQATAVRDPQRLRYYFSTYLHPSPVSVRLEELIKTYNEIASLKLSEESAPPDASRDFSRS
jgi:choloylglycine hydrolase